MTVHSLYCSVCDHGVAMHALAPVSSGHAGSAAENMKAFTVCMCVCALCCISNVPSLQQQGLGEDNVSAC